MKTTKSKNFKLTIGVTAVVIAWCLSQCAHADNAAPAAPVVPPAPYTDQLQNSPVVSLDFVAADINDVLKALAVQTGANIVTSADVKGSITVSLNKVTLDQALELITHISGFAYAKSGNTYLVGTKDSIAAISPPPIANVAPPATQVVVFNYANVDDLTAMLKNRFPDIKISSGTSISGQKAGFGAKAIILTGDPDLVKQAADLVAQVDAALGANVAQSQTEVYRVHYASLPDLINILNSLVPSLVVTPGPAQGFSAKAPSAAAAAASSGGSSTGTAPPPPSGGSGASGASQNNAAGPNLLLLTGTEVDIARGLDILNKVDVRPAELLYETKVTELTLNAQHNLGLNWSFANATTQIGEVYPGNTQTPVTTPAPVNYPGNVLKFGTFGRSQIPDLATVSLDAMFQDGDSKLLADPNIAALDGQAAQVFIGNTVNYVESITQSSTGENVTTGTVQVGVILRVTGKVDADGMITLNIHPEVSSITQFLPVPGGGSLPEVATRFADTTIRVHDGETVAIGGLIQENDLTTTTSVPGLGQLPLIGYLFKDAQKTKNRDEVVFFLKTSLMKDS